MTRTSRTPLRSTSSTSLAVVVVTLLLLVLVLVQVLTASATGTDASPCNNNTSWRLSASPNATSLSGSPLLTIHVDVPTSLAGVVTVVQSPGGAFDIAIVATSFTTFASAVTQPPSAYNGYVAQISVNGTFTLFTSPINITSTNITFAPSPSKSGAVRRVAHSTTTSLLIPALAAVAVAGTHGAGASTRISTTAVALAALACASAVSPAHATAASPCLNTPSITVNISVPANSELYAIDSATVTAQNATGLWFILTCAPGYSECNGDMASDGCETASVACPSTSPTTTFTTTSSSIVANQGNHVFSGFTALSYDGAVAAALLIYPIAGPFYQAVALYDRWGPSSASANYTATQTVVPGESLYSSLALDDAGLVMATTAYDAATFHDDTFVYQRPWRGAQWTLTAVIPSLEGHGYPTNSNRTGPINATYAAVAVDGRGVTLACAYTSIAVYARTNPASTTWTITTVLYPDGLNQPGYVGDTLNEYIGDIVLSADGTVLLAASFHTAPTYSMWVFARTGATQTSSSWTQLQRVDAGVAPVPLNYVSWSSAQSGEQRSYNLTGSVRVVLSRDASTAVLSAYEYWTNTSSFGVWVLRWNSTAYAPYANVTSVPSDGVPGALGQFTRALLSLPIESTDGVGVPANASYVTASAVSSDGTVIVVGDEWDAGVGAVWQLVDDGAGVFVAAAPKTTLAWGLASQANASYHFGQGGVGVSGDWSTALAFAYDAPFTARALITQDLGYTSTASHFYAYGLA